MNLGCSFSKFTATKSDQVQQVAACETAVGEVTIYGDSFGSIDLTGVQQFYGDLTVLNATQAQSFLAPTLQLISGALTLSQNTILANVNLAQLTTVGTLEYNALPALTSTGLTSGITSAEQVVISDTSLTSLEGINVFELKVFDVNNNKDIESIDSGLQSVTDTLSIAFNSDNVDVVLDQLTSANSVFFQSINSFSANNLTAINGSLAVSSSSVDKVEFKNLKSIGKSLTINQNDDLEEIDFPKLTEIGGALQISDNDKLRSFSGFDKLKTIGGSVSINGTFDNGTFESLQRIAGGFTLLTDGELSCDSFASLNKAGDIKGDKYVCSGTAGASSSSSKKKNSDSSSDSSSSASGSQASGSSSSTRSSEGVASHGKGAAVFALAAAVGAAIY